MIPFFDTRLLKLHSLQTQINARNRTRHFSRSYLYPGMEIVQAEDIFADFNRSLGQRLETQIYFSPETIQNWARKNEVASWSSLAVAEEFIDLLQRKIDPQWNEYAMSTNKSIEFSKAPYNAVDGEDQVFLVGVYPLPVQGPKGILVYGVVVIMGYPYYLERKAEYPYALPFVIQYPIHLGVFPPLSPDKLPKTLIEIASYGVEEREGNPSYITTSLEFGPTLPDFTVAGFTFTARVSGKKRLNEKQLDDILGKHGYLAEE